jgi:anti-sigma factor RsiW
MDRKTTTQLMRLLHDELPEPVARELRDRLHREPELQRQFETLEQQWRGLELPDPQPAPPGFATRVMARARESKDQGLAPAWWSHTLAGRATTAVLLAGGIAFGAILASPSEAEDWNEYLAAEPMAESYWVAMEQPEDDSWQENGS